MRDLTKYPATELLKQINDAKKDHETTKKIIIDFSFDLDKIQEKINENIIKLNEIEKNYVELIEEIDNRNATR